MWALLGVGYSAVLTPGGRLLRRSANAADRPDVYAAQFSLSHVCWLVTYLLAGWLTLPAGVPLTSVVLATVAAVGVLTAWVVWPANDPEILEHTHPRLNSDHPHLQADESKRHAHPFVIDDLHQSWPSPWR